MRRRRFLRMREINQTRRIIVLAALSLAMIGVLVGCGDRRLLLKVDVHSFLSTAQRQASYGPIPPGAAASVSVTQNTNINLLSGLGGVVDVEALDLSVQGIFDNQAGSGTADICVIFAQPGGAVVDSLTFPIILQGGVVDTVDAEISGSQALANLFGQENLEVTVRLDFAADGPVGLAPALRGEFELTRLLVLLTTRRED